MGTWGALPFCNDDILNDISGLWYSQEETKVIEEACNEWRHYLGNYEVAALLLDSTVGTHYICDRETLKALVNIIKLSVKDKIYYSDDSFFESYETLLSFCSTPIEYRKQLVDKLLHLFDYYNKECIYKQFISSWNDPEPYRKYYNAVWKKLKMLKLNQNYSNAVVIEPNIWDRYVTISSFFNPYCDDIEVINKYLAIVEDNSIIVQGLAKDENYYIISTINSASVTELPKQRIEWLKQHNKLYRPKVQKNVDKDTNTGKLQVVIINTIRKSNKILGYTIKDRTGVQKNVCADALKSAIRSGTVEVINYTLTTDNRLVPSKHSI